MDHRCPGLAFFLGTPLAIAGVISPSSLLGRLVLWGHGGNEYLVMLTVINIALGGYLLWAGTNLVRYWLAVDIFLVAETAHVLSMMAMALAPQHHMHWFGDASVPAVLLIFVASVWLPRRSAIIASSHP